ncbi:MAG: tetratricopeptide repeat protein [Verrucomicrobiia bacterium]
MNLKMLLFGVGLSLMLAGQTLRAQQRDADLARIHELRASADRGDAKAQIELGVCYDKGQGVRKDEVEAVKWFRKAAEQNLAVAQYNLGVSYATGQGVTNDVVEARKWFRKAAEQNLAAAQYNLGDCYDRGHGVKKDEVEAVKWMALAAAQGMEEAKAAIPLLQKKLPEKQIEDGEWRAIDWLENWKRATATAPQQ